MRAPRKILRLHERLVDEAGSVLAEKSARRASIENAMTGMRGAMQAELSGEGAASVEGRALAIAYWRSGERLLGRLSSTLREAQDAEASAREALLAAYEEKERIARYASRLEAQRRKETARRLQNAEWDRIALGAAGGDAEAG